MKTFFKELFDYSHHSNQQLIHFLSGNAQKMPEQSLQLISHILNAHQVWNSRIQNQQPLYGVWEIHSVAALQQIDTNNYRQSVSILDQYNPDEIITYTNSKGQHFTNSIRDILFHVINHSTYHRAQVATCIRQSGSEPFSTDYIFFKR